MAKEYIPREAVIKEVCHGCNAEFGEYPCEPQDCSIMARLKNIPAADVVERPRWISVKERLPEKSGEYLVARSYGYGSYIDVVSYAISLEKADKIEFEGIRRGGFYDYGGEYGGNYEILSVTHWQYLPEPPKEDENG